MRRFIASQAEAVQISEPLVNPSQDRRRLSRESVYKAENCFITCRGYSFRLRVIDLTAFGARCEFRPQTSMNGTPLFSNDILKEIRVHYNDRVIGTVPEAMIVYQDRKPSGLITIGLKFETIPNRIGKRTSERVPTHPIFQPTASTADPVHYDRTMHFKITDLSNEGLRLECSPRNRLVLVGAKLERVIVNLPTVGSFEVSLEVRHLTFDEKENRLVLGTRITSRPNGFDAGIVRYLFAFPDDEIKSDPIQWMLGAGFQPKYFKTHLQFGAVSNLQEYREILSVRLRAYGTHGKVDIDKGKGAMSDYYDLTSRIFWARAGKKIVGSVRVTFVNRPEDQFELEASLKIPAGIDREKTFEVSRLCVDPSYESTDLVFGLVERAVALGLQEGIQSVITSCTQDKLDYYQKLGFRIKGKPFGLSTLGGIPHYFLVLDTRKVATSRRMNPLYWRFAYSSVVRFLKTLGFLKGQELTPWKKLLLRLAWPVFQALRKSKKRRK